METGYDIIGDVHGHAAAQVMGYNKRDGVWCHSERTAAFVGDFVDRGPENLRVCRIVIRIPQLRRNYLRNNCWGGPGAHRPIVRTQCRGRDCPGSMRCTFPLLQLRAVR
jgi:hypothetical protein